MSLENKMKHLIELIPVVDKLAVNQEKNTESLNQVIDAVGKNNLAVSEMRLSNMKLAEAIEKLIVKIDKVDQFEQRLLKLEHIVLK
jgi:hypothetical protein